MAEPRTSEAVEDEFLAIVCADEQLLQLEFDAIVSAQWGDPPPDDADGDEVCRRTPVQRTSEFSGSTPPARRSRGPNLGRWVRQRSPPHASGSSTSESKGR